MIDRYGSPGRAMGLRQLMDRLLEDAFIMPREGWTGGNGWGSSAVDVYEEGDTLVVEAQLPGLKPDDLDVQVERGVLTISGRTASEQERKERNYLLRERTAGRFTRSLQLPTSYAADPSEATYEHGVLRLVFPKTEEAKPRRIQLGTGGQQAMSSGESKQQSGETTGRRRG